MSADRRWGGYRMRELGYLIPFVAPEGAIQNLICDATRRVQFNTAPVKQKQKKMCEEFENDAT